MVAAFRSGRASLKRYLSDQAALDVAALPYDPEVICYVEDRRAKGGRTVLITASDDKIAQDVAAHLGIFYEVYGSNGSLNLKGEHKQAFLTEKFGDTGYNYVGDSVADVAVWKNSANAVTVNSDDLVREAVEQANSWVEHLVTRPSTLGPYITALRPHQRLKNALIFVPMMVGHACDTGTRYVSLVAFVCFCTVVSSVYVTNDLLDLAADRAQPKKCALPFASGEASIIHGTFISFGVATGTTLSVWLLMFSMFFFLSLAAVKRQAELIDNEKRGQPEVNGRGYTVGDLEIISMIAVSAGFVSVLVLGLYLNSPEVTELYSRPELLWGACLVLLFWITRILMVAHRGAMHDDPVIYAAKDKVSLMCLAAILLFALLGV